MERILNVILLDWLEMKEKISAVQRGRVSSKKINHSPSNSPQDNN